MGYESYHEAFINERLLANVALAQRLARQRHPAIHEKGDGGGDEVGAGVDGREGEVKGQKGQRLEDDERELTAVEEQRGERLARLVAIENARVILLNHLKLHVKYGLQEALIRRIILQLRIAMAHELLQKHIQLPIRLTLW